MLNTMRELGLIDEDKANAILDCFSKMEICEEEIARAQQRWPEKAELIFKAFTIALSPVIPSAAPEKLFRYHCRQLMRMVAMDEDLDMPTGVEAACMVVAVANKVPIKLEVVMKVLGDFETAEAFNVEEITTSLKNVGARYDEDFRKAYRRVYKVANDRQTRAQHFAARLKRGY